MLAFFLLLAIGIYNSRNGEPLDVSDIMRSTPVAERVGLEYPQIDMTEKIAKEEAEAKKKAAEAKKKEAETKKKEAAVQKSGDDKQGKETAQEAKTGQKEAENSPDSAPEKAEEQKTEAKPAASPLPTSSSAAQSKKQDEKTAAASDDKGNASAETATPAASATPPKLQDPASVPSMVYDNSWPPPKDRPRTDSTFLRRIPTMLFFLAIVCALIWISLRIVLPFSGKLTGTVGKKKQINLIERLSIGPNRSIVLLQVADKRILVGVTEKGMNTLAELTVPTEDEEEKPKDAPVDPQGPKKDLVKEVLAQRLSALPLMDLRSKS